MGAVSRCLRLGSVMAIPQPPLSDRILALIAASRIVSFQTWHPNYSTEALQVFQAADDARQYLSDADFAQLNQLAAPDPALISLAQALRDRSGDIVDEARAKVLESFPAITQPGGGLYPAERATACWRDFWHFLRCITYGIAGQRTDYLSTQGLQAMEELYQALQVPLAAMIVGLEGVKTASLKPMSPEEQEMLHPYFDPLIEALKQFRPAA